MGHCLDAVADKLRHFQTPACWIIPRGRKPVWYNGLGWECIGVGRGLVQLGRLLGLADEKSSGDTAAVESFAAWKCVVRSERQRDLGAKPEPLLGAQFVARAARPAHGVSVRAVGSLTLSTQTALLTESASGKLATWPKSR